jgi:L-fuconolactonase
MLVQAAPIEAETAFMLDVARHSADWGPRGWDFAHHDAQTRITAWASEALLKGLRPIAGEYRRHQLDSA